MMVILGVLNLVPTPTSVTADSSKNERITLQPVDEGTVDTDPLRTSLRLVPFSPSDPYSFDQLWRDDSGLFFRVEGNIYAVFPQSEYVPTGNGNYALIPADTKFYIGPPPFLTSDSTNAQVSPEPPFRTSSYSAITKQDTPRSSRFLEMRRNTRVNQLQPEERESETKYTKAGKHTRTRPVSVSNETEEKKRIQRVCELIRLSAKHSAK